MKKQELLTHKQSHELLSWRCSPSLCWLGCVWLPSEFPFSTIIWSLSSEGQVGRWSALGCLEAPRPPSHCGVHCLNANRVGTMAAKPPDFLEIQSMYPWGLWQEIQSYRDMGMCDWGAWLLLRRQPTEFIFSPLRNLSQNHNAMLAWRESSWSYSGK